jgi:hypothetical protein
MDRRFVGLHDDVRVADANVGEVGDGQAEPDHQNGKPYRKPDSDTEVNKFWDSEFICHGQTVA